MSREAEFDDELDAASVEEGFETLLASGPTGLEDRFSQQINQP